MTKSIAVLRSWKRQHSQVIKEERRVEEGPKSADRERSRVKARPKASPNKGETIWTGTSRDNTRENKLNSRILSPCVEGSAGEFWAGRRKQANKREEQATADRSKYR
jgi:hypothetical protein